jgi:hypothetical protein
MSKNNFYDEIRFNLKNILTEYINKRPVLEVIAFPAEIVGDGNSKLTMTFQKFPQGYGWYFKTDVISVLLEAMMGFAKRHHCKDADYDEMWDIFEETYDFDWDFKMYDNICDNTLKITRKLPF